MDVFESIKPFRIVSPLKSKTFEDNSIPTRIDRYKRATILIFEDSIEMQEHYRLFLEDDYNLLMVDSVARGLYWLQRLTIDVVLLNVEVNREAEAVRLLNILRRLAAGASIPVIATTGYSGSRERELLSRARFDAYVARPFTLRKLRDVISKAIAKRTISILNGIDLGKITQKVPLAS